MEELRQILITHAGRYLRLQPTDAVKLIYQNEFGGGHMIRDRETCLAYLNREYKSVEKDGSVPLYEDIGNGIVRVNLAAVEPCDLDWLGEAFLSSAAKHRGEPERFLKKLEVLKELTQAGAFSFHPQELEAYLREYEKAGYPMVSHSSVYREAYRPAYRIVLRELMQPEAD